MLILTRKKEESIVIGENIEIVVVGIEDNKVKLGIKAPKDIDIYRSEIYKEIQEENLKASRTEIKMSNIENIFKK
ncbi:carbon storage regulator CsrA [Sporosalibacterium faouarense]|uniref:carbon storage regulator CsrA n=1 Tax=Sporosalibacterium faouarense TaxID=516123 RepID=UPI00141CE47B|nr:carbon storage regulator CsrA [Sporosalibacterium faouarense]MTI46802.1 carbon storage regulator CsrA [Bacillota bacterium]